MILGIGIDMVDMARMERLYERFGDRCFGHMLAPGEIAAIPKLVVPYLASRFAAKEAAVKALGTGFAFGITPRQIEVARDGLGKPILFFHGEAMNRANQLGATAFHLSLTHERHCAIALVILED